MPVTKETLDEIALTQGEYEAIVERLGREPNSLELGMFGALWSEHCGYKHSKPLLKLLPSQSPRLLVPPGAENAGAVDIGDGLAIVLKIESHNHPSAVEPYQGAATGVGGIIRDILAMGARPIALLNSLRFGPLSEVHNRYLFEGVVGGISGYGNCIGIPDVGGEIYFSPSYSNNPLVNAMCVGLVKKEDIIRSAAKGVGNLLMLVGAETGRDGIHGASGLASRTFEDQRELRPTVQVGNPFLEKVLIEACLEAVGTGHVLGLQDLGAAGLTSSIVESAERGGGGVELDVALVPRRDTGMTPYGVMLSESQERMLLVVLEGHQDQVRTILDKWDLQSTIIGRVTEGNSVTVLDGQGPAAELSVRLLTDPPTYTPEATRPAWLQEAWSFDLSSLPLPVEGASTLLLRLLASPNVASKEWVYRQYDHQVQTNTVVAPGGDAALLRIPGTKKAIALCTDGNGRLCYLDPHAGGAIAVAEACRNLSCVGAQPIALTDCLNFGNPEEPQVYFQLKSCIEGIAEACQALDVPIVSGNVSLYNETRGQATYPTPVVGALGLVEELDRVSPLIAGGNSPTAFKAEGDVVLLLGASEINGDPAMLAGSEYLEVAHGKVAGRPTIDLDLEARVQRACRRGITDGIIKSAHDCSDGGLAVALAESCISGGMGFKGDFHVHGRWDAALFGEAQSRILVSVAPLQLQVLELIAREESIPWMRLGLVEGSRFVLPGLIDEPVAALKEAWAAGLEKAIQGQA